MSEARLRTYLVAYDEGDYSMPVAACLDKKTAERIEQECIDHLFGIRKKRWLDRFDDDPASVLPFHDEDERELCEERVKVVGWDVPFCQVDEATDPHVFEALTTALELYDGLDDW